MSYAGALRRSWAKPARGRRPGRKKGMNGLEADYAHVLNARVASGEVLWWVFESVTLKLAEDTRYTPDFFVMLTSGELEGHEVKGGIFEDDAKVKAKVAAALFPFRFVIARRALKRDGGGWSTQEVSDGQAR